LVREIKPFRRLALYHARQHWHLIEQCPDVPQDDAGLLAVGRNDEDGAAFARCEERSIVVEAGQEHGDQGEDE